MSHYLLTHLVAAGVCFILGAVLALSPKGGARHRLLGRIWWAVMVIVALSSFGTGPERRPLVMDPPAVDPDARDACARRLGDLPRRRG